MPAEIDPIDAEELLDHFDGLLLLGGPDLDPSTYGAEPDSHIYGVNQTRDIVRDRAHAASRWSAEMPTLAICRGAQLLNVVLGGNLDQHITGRAGLIGHGIPGVEGGAQLHDLEIEPGSRLGRGDGHDARRVLVASPSGRGPPRARACS